MAKERITITIGRDLLKWIDERIEEKIFANRSHCFEFLIAKEKRGEKGVKKLKSG